MFRLKIKKKIVDNALDLMTQLFPLNRSLTGKDNLKSLYILKKFLKKIKIIKFKSGTKIFDWIIPKEWNVEDAFIIDPQNKKICDFKKNNLHLVGYSQPKSTSMSFKKLKNHLYFLNKLPNAIPYITSYYDKSWGFCLSKNHYKKLKAGNYKVYIKSKFSKGNLIIGDYIKKGKSDKEILFSANICHPSMANNELSGPVLMTLLAKELAKLDTFYTYRFVYMPETIGCLAYINKNIEVLKKRLLAGFHLTCIGYGKNISIIKTKNEDTYTNKILKIILNKNYKGYKEYSFLDRGSDERQYNAPGIELPVATIMRTKFGSYKQYHTSLDNMEIFKKSEIDNSFSFLRDVIEFIENDFILKSNVVGEPFFRKYNMYRKLGTNNALTINEQDIFNICSYSNYIRFSDLCLKLKRKPGVLLPIIKLLKQKKIITINK